jgi:hypothetical protein
MTTLPAIKGATGQIWRMPAYMARAAKYAAADVLYDPASLKNNGFILSSLVQVALRITLGWINEKATQDPGQKDLRFREAIRTTLRETGGFTMSYMVLRETEKIIKAVLEKLQGPAARVKRPPMAFDRLCRDLSQGFKALFQGKPLPKLSPNRLEELEKTAPYIPDMQSVLGRWFTRQTQNGWLKGKNPAALMKLTHEWLPVSIGSAVAVALSGFWLEWLTLHKSEQIVTFTSKQIKKHRIRPKGIPDFNVNEFVGGVMEERWRRQQVDEPWFAGRRPSLPVPPKT